MGFCALLHILKSNQIEKKMTFFLTHCLTSSRQTKSALCVVLAHTFLYVNKSLKKEKDVSYVNIRFLTSLEHLSVEIFLQIFGYLSLQQLITAFFGVSFYIDSICKRCKPCGEI